MLIAAAFVPSPPLLVPELAGLASGDTDDLRRAALAATAHLSEAVEWAVVGTGPQADGSGAGRVGTFAGFGVDVTVRLTPAADGPADPRMPLPALIAGWLRERSAPAARAEVHLLDAAAPGEQCARTGRALRSRLDRDATPRALLVVADGAATLTDRAPGAFDPRSAAVEERLAGALAAGDPRTLAALDAALCSEIVLDGRAAWQVLAGAFGDPPSAVEMLYSDAPYGVGYHVGTWRP